MNISMVLILGLDIYAFPVAETLHFSIRNFDDLFLGRTERLKSHR
jgi:hypothetical protein